MRPFVARRWIAAATSVVAGVVFVVALVSSYPTLREGAFFSGWVLAGLSVFLTAYNLRKKFPYPPILSSAAWLQLHVYAGLLSAVVFVLHVGARLPDGPFEIALALLFAALIVSGVFGLVLSRVAPSRLSVRGEEVLFERVPMLRRVLRERAEALVVETVRETDASTLTDFYARHLAEYFGGARNLGRHLCQSRAPRERLIARLRSLDRFLSDRERRNADELAELIDAKDALDYHHAMQGLLKTWLFVHVPLTYVMLIFMVLHAVVVHTFAGGAS